MKKIPILIAILLLVSSLLNATEQDQEIKIGVALGLTSIAAPVLEYKSANSLSHLS